MDKLSLTCLCGQDMIVPTSALHRAGLCPNCGAKILITEENTRPVDQRRRGSLLSRMRDIQTTTEPREEAWREFAAAVDLYNARRYAEALTLLNALGKKFPGNIHIEAARDQCMAALQQTVEGASNYNGHPINDDVLSPELIKRIVLDKLKHGATEDVQLRAAEIAAQILGLSSTQDKAQRLDRSDKKQSIVIEGWSRARRPLPSDAPESSE